MNKIPDFKIEVYSHFFKLTEVQSYALPYIYEFLRRMVQYEVNRAVKNKTQYTPIRTFGFKSKTNREFRMHINQLDEFIYNLESKGIPVREENIIRVPMYIPEPLLYPIQIVKQLRDYQEKVVSHIVTPMPGHRTKLVGLPTGTGKTFTSLYATSKIALRVCIIILPAYIEKWVIDIQENLNVDLKAIMTVQGSGQLKGLIDLAVTGMLKADYIIISTRTMQNFIESYSMDPDYCVEDFGMAPEDLYKALKIGRVIIDETHQHIHAVFKIMLFMHVPELISLSATLISDDPLVQRVHAIMYPKEVRYDELLMEKYIKVYAVDYSYKDYQYRKIRTTEFGSNTYSHIAYEKSILRNEVNKYSYLSMIKYMSKLGYVDYRTEGDKLIIFVSSRNMGMAVIDYLKNEMPDFDTRLYMEGEPYSNVLESDIIVSTIQSAGTALDIPNLITVLMTVSVSSSVANIQTLGRLRKLKDKEVRFYYTYCTDVKKQLDTHYKRVELFTDRVSSIKSIQYSRQL